MRAEGDPPAGVPECAAVENLAGTVRPCTVRVELGARATEGAPRERRAARVDLCAAEGADRAETRQGMAERHSRLRAADQAPRPRPGVDELLRKARWIREVQVEVQTPERARDARQAPPDEVLRLDLRCPHAAEARGAQGQGQSPARGHARQRHALARWPRAGVAVVQLRRENRTAPAPRCRQRRWRPRHQDNAHVVRRRRNREPKVLGESKAV